MQCFVGQGEKNADKEDSGISEGTRPSGLKKTGHVKTVARPTLQVEFQTSVNEPRWYRPNGVSSLVFSAVYK